MNRIAVIGPGGAGKSRLARQLEQTLGIRLIQLDQLYWKPGWIPTPEEEWEALQRRESLAESWIVENISENGYGALVPAATTDWIRVDELIGVQLEGTSEWGIALVRRVVRDEQRQYHVGIEMISRTVSLVRIGQCGW